MASLKRRQHRSCDQCRKGKRGCDARLPQPSHMLQHYGDVGDPELYVRANGPCSNCKKWRRECTFKWLDSVQTRLAERRQHGQNRSRKGKYIGDAALNVPELGINPESNNGSSMFGISPVDTVRPSAYDWTTFESSGTYVPDVARLNHLDEQTFMDPSVNRGDYAIMTPITENFDSIFDGDDVLSGSSLDSLAEISHEDQDQFSCSIAVRPKDNHPRNYNKNVGDNIVVAPLLSEQPQIHPLGQPYYPKEMSPSGLRSSSHTLTAEYNRSTLTENFFRIYHDSMENALSCWLNERNCPYSGIIGRRYVKKPTLLSNTMKSEWGPNWSNRICARVCRLDRVSVSIRGRELTAIEEKAASQTLQTVIIAFAAQWLPQRNQSETSVEFQSFEGRNTSRSSGMCHPTSTAHPPVLEHLWNQARQALNSSADIPSFRIIFANIVFSLTQRPLNVGEQIQSLSSEKFPRDEVHQMPELTGLYRVFDADPSHLFLETAVRQLFSYRFKLTMLLRQRSVQYKDTRVGPNPRHANRSPLRRSSPNECGSEAMSSGLNAEDQETFNLLFWLGIMFDTLTAAMHQRPPIVTDEDSELSCVNLPQRQSPNLNEIDIDLDGMSFGEDIVEGMDVWGDLFLSNGQMGQRVRNLRWPCAYEEAAEILSDAAPVKVLLFRRVGRLQTLVYRGAGRECIEDGIRDAFKVYGQWNCTYGRFLIDCLAYHDKIPPRIQSWYIILAAHWHLGAILLADTLENVDRAHLGHETNRESRLKLDVVSVLRHENAAAVSDIAQCSLRGQDQTSARNGFFHDDIDRGAFLAEPWTEVLIRSLTCAGCTLLRKVDVSTHSIHLPQNDPSEDARRRCMLCIDALQCLGDKSNMAALAAQTLFDGLQGRTKARVLHWNAAPND